MTYMTAAELRRWSKIMQGNARGNIERKTGCHARRVPAPWLIEERPESFIVKDGAGQPLC
jgi:hypothetical protein